MQVSVPVPSLPRKGERMWVLLRNRAAIELGSKQSELQGMMRYLQRFQALEIVKRAMTKAKENAIKGMTLI